MTREETLKILSDLNKLLDSMSDEELYEHMMKTSPSFREIVEKLDKFLEELGCSYNGLLCRLCKPKIRFRLPYGPIKNFKR